MSLKWLKIIKFSFALTSNAPLISLSSVEHLRKENQQGLWAELTHLFPCKELFLQTKSTEFLASFNPPGAVWTPAGWAQPPVASLVSLGLELWPFGAAGWGVSTQHSQSCQGGRENPWVSFYQNLKIICKSISHSWAKGSAERGLGWWPLTSLGTYRSQVLHNSDHFSSSLQWQGRNQVLHPFYIYIYI